jgi:hypothetical protein
MNDRACLRDGVRPHLESLEARLLLSGTAAQQGMELFSVSPALFVENQGQWADPSVRYIHQGNGVNVAMTDAGPVFQVLRDDPANPQGPSDPPADRIDPEGHNTQILQFSASFVGAAGHRCLLGCSPARRWLPQGAPCQPLHPGRRTGQKSARELLVDMDLRCIIQSSVLHDGWDGAWVAVPPLATFVGTRSGKALGRSA